MQRGPEVRTCGVCGDEAAETVEVNVAGRELELELCDRHLAELLRGARRSRGT